MRFAILYHLYNLKNVKRLQLYQKKTLLRGCFSSFLNCTNGTKSRKASHIVNFIQKVINFFHTKRRSMSLNGATCMKRKRKCSIALSFKPTAVSKLLEQYGYPNICTQ